MNILVYEHVSGGGFAGKSMPLGILSEGFGMLRTLISDFKAAGHNVTTVLDSRLAVFNPPIDADRIVRVSSVQEAEAALAKIPESVDAAYIIAPESDGVLKSLVAGMEHMGVSSLNCTANVIGKVSDKPVLLEHAKGIGLATPSTVILSTRDDIAEIKQTIACKLGFPLVIKPADGVGCSGLSVARNENQVASAVARVVAESPSRYFMAQELVQGTAVSVSLFSTDTEVFSISLNKQNVSLKPPASASTYNGGQVPLNSPRKHEAFALAGKLVRSLRGLRGYVGVDLVLTEKGPMVIEANPRLTTSYLGITRIAGFNPAQAIIDAVLENELPGDSQGKGYAVFSKIMTPKPTAEVLQETYDLEEIISPPFPISGNSSTCALILSHRATLRGAMSGLHEAKKRLRSIL